MFLNPENALLPPKLPAFNPLFSILLVNVGLLVEPNPEVFPEVLPPKLRAPELLAPKLWLLVAPNPLPPKPPNVGDLLLLVCEKEVLGVKEEKAEKAPVVDLELVILNGVFINTSIILINALALIFKRI